MRGRRKFVLAITVEAMKKKEKEKERDTKNRIRKDSLI